MIESKLDITPNQIYLRILKNGTGGFNYCGDIYYAELGPFSWGSLLNVGCQSQRTLGPF